MKDCFTRTVIHSILLKAGQTQCLPLPNEDLGPWLASAASRSGGKNKAVRSLLSLSVWRVWKLRNDCIFKDTSPVVSSLVEASLWGSAGARALRGLPLHARPPESLTPFPSLRLHSFVCFLSFLSFF